MSRPLSAFHFRAPFFPYRHPFFWMLIFTISGWTDDVAPKLTIHLSTDNPAASAGQLGDFTFPVGYGKDGLSEAGTTFRGGVSLLGQFRINAILTQDGRFEMDPDLIEKSGKTEAWLRENLFKNMSSIDFDGDGRGGEYGDAFISLKPLGCNAPQPFAFDEYRDVFRWYSYALHGTQDETRVGQKITGGCINVKGTDLAVLLREIQLGDIIAIHSL